MLLAETDPGRSPLRPGVWKGDKFPEKSITKMYSSTLLALRGGGWASHFQKKALRNICVCAGRALD